MTEFPRVLFVTPHAFNHITGGGITFSNLFAGWPKDRLATVHSDHVPTSGDVCGRYFPLGRAELDVWPWLRRGMSALGWGTAKEIASVPSQPNTPVPAPAPTWMRRVQSLFFDAELPRTARLSPDLDAWIAEFRPQVLYTILGSNGFMDLVELIRRRFDLPVVVHVMDDWASSAHRSGLFGPAQRLGMQRRLRHVHTVAADRLAISDAMAEAYQQRYGQSFTAIQNPVDLARWRGLADAPAASPWRGDVLYVGSVFQNAQLDSLIDCGKAVADLADAGHRVTLTIAAPAFQIAPFRDRLAFHPAIRLVDPISDDEAFFRRIAEADVLLLPVNFDQDSTRFIRYSMPTKVPAYLFSGTPVLVYGPSGLAQVDYAARQGWGEVVSRRDPAALQDALLRLMQDGALRQRLGQTGRRLAEERHDAARIRPQFRAILAQAARQNGRAG